MKIQINCKIFLIYSRENLEIINKEIKVVQDDVEK